MLAATQQLPSSGAVTAVQVDCDEKFIKITTDCSRSSYSTSMTGDKLNCTKLVWNSIELGLNFCKTNQQTPS